MTDLSVPRRFPVSLTLFVLALLLFVSLLSAGTIGEVHLAPGAILHSVGHRIAPMLVSDADSTTSSILFDLRLPRILLAALVGACLALAGAVLQGLTQNALADPYTVGVSSGASVGAGIAILTGIAGAWNGLGQSLLAFVAALLTMGIVFTLSRIGGRIHTAGFLLAGIVVGSFLWSVTTLLLSLAKSDQQQILAFLMGRFNEAVWANVAILLPLMILGVVLFTVAGRGLDAFCLR